MPEFLSSRRTRLLLGALNAAALTLGRLGPAAYLVSRTEPRVAP